MTGKRPSERAERAEALILFGTRLRELRLRAGLRQEDLAERAGIDRIAISQIERGTRDVGVSRVTVLARALGVEASALFAPAEISTEDA